MVNKPSLTSRKRALTLPNQVSGREQVLLPVPTCSVSSKTKPSPHRYDKRDRLTSAICDSISYWRLRGCSEGYIIKRIDRMEEEMPGELHEEFNAIRTQCDLTPRPPPPTVPLPTPQPHIKPVPLHLPSITLSRARHIHTQSSDTIIDIFSPRPPETPAVPIIPSSTPWCPSTSPVLDVKAGGIPADGYMEGFHTAEVDGDTLSRFPRPPDRSQCSLSSTTTDSDSARPWIERDSGAEDNDDDSSEDARTITAATPNSASTNIGWSAIWSEPSFEDSEESHGYGVLVKDPGPSAAALVREAYLQQRFCSGD